MRVLGKPTWNSLVAATAIGRRDWNPTQPAEQSRTLVCYRVATGATDPTQLLSDDPVYGTGLQGVITARWRDPSPQSSPKIGCWD